MLSIDKGILRIENRGVELVIKCATGEAELKTLMSPNEALDNCIRAIRNEREPHPIFRTLDNALCDTPGFDNYDGSRTDGLFLFLKYADALERMANVGFRVEGLPSIERNEMGEKLKNFPIDGKIQSMFDSFDCGRCVSLKYIRSLDTYLSVPMEELNYLSEILHCSMNDTIDYLDRYKLDRKGIEWIHYLNDNKHFQYLESFRSHLFDYMNDLLEAKEENLYPKNFYESWALLRMRIELKKNAEIAARMMQHYNPKLAFEDDNYIVIVPTTVEQIHEEGRKQKNCVAGYISDIANGETYVVLVRKKATPNVALITCQITPGNLDIRQERYSLNREITQQADIDFMRKYREHLLKVRRGEV